MNAPATKNSRQLQTDLERVRNEQTAAKAEVQSIEGRIRERREAAALRGVGYPENDREADHYELTAAKGRLESLNDTAAILERELPVVRRFEARGQLDDVLVQIEEAREGILESFSEAVGLFREVEEIDHRIKIQLADFERLRVEAVQAAKDAGVRVPDIPRPPVREVGDGAFSIFQRENQVTRSARFYRAESPEAFQSKMGSTEKKKFGRQRRNDTARGVARFFGIEARAVSHLIQNIGGLLRFP